MLASKDLKKFEDVFLSNHLCKKIQNALADELIPLTQEQMPPYVDVLESVFIKRKQNV